MLVGVYFKSLGQAQVRLVGGILTWSFAVGLGSGPRATEVGSKGDGWREGLPLLVQEEIGRRGHLGDLLMGLDGRGVRGTSKI